MSSYKTLTRIEECKQMHTQNLYGMQSSINTSNCNCLQHEVKGMIGGDGVQGVGNHSMQTVLTHSLALKIPGIVENI